LGLKVYLNFILWCYCRTHTIVWFFICT